VVAEVMVEVTCRTDKEAVMNEMILSPPARDWLTIIKKEEFKRPGEIHGSCLLALFNRKLVVAVMGRKQGEHNGPWIRLRRHPYESDNRRLAGIQRSR